jgi:periplasmic protein TonB
VVSGDGLPAIARDMRAAVREHLRLEVTLEPPPPEPEPEPPPPEPEITPPPPPPKAPDDPYETPPREEDPYDLPPAPAEAAKVLTQEPEDTPAKPEETIASGEGEVGFGRVAGAGTGNAPTFSRHAAVGGVQGGRGTALPPGPPRPDLSRPPDLLGDREWDCGFPAQADADGVLGGLVRMIIWVRPDGLAQAAKVVSDPGHGFGAQAHGCALKHHYRPGRDRAGRPVAGVIGPIGIRFIR